MVLLKAKGDPIAMTNSPGLKLLDWPNFITGRFLQGIRTVAKSDFMSTSSIVPKKSIY